MGQLTAGLNRFAVEVYWKHRIQFQIPLPIIAVTAGVPAGLCVGAAIGARLRKKRRGFPIDVTPSRR